MGIARLVSTIRDISFKRRNLEPPVANLILEDDFLIFTFWTQSSNFSFAIGARIQQFDGQVIDLEDQFTLGAGQRNLERRLRLSRGFLRSTICRLTVGSITQPNDIWVSCVLAHGDATNFARVQTLFSDTLTRHHPLSWPGSHVRFPRELPGAINLKEETDPALGTGSVLITVGTQEVWRIHTVRFTLACDATVVNRWIQMRYLDGGTELWAANDPNGTTASQNTNYHFQRHVQRTDRTFGQGHVPLPDNPYLLQTNQLQILVLNMQAGDQLSNIKTVYERWLV